MDKTGNDVDVESVGESGSEVELNLKTKAGRGTADWKGEGIQVKTDVDLKIEEIRQGIESEVRRTQERTPGLSSNPSRSNFTSRGN
jgi:hypothetical protein